MKFLILTLYLLPVLCFAQGTADWQSVDYPGHGQVTVQDDVITLERGQTVTAVRWVGDVLPVTDYEITYEAMRTAGEDFFCALTFPVDSSFATLVLGGWRGHVTGLSCINGIDASQNFTGRKVKYENNRWYQIKLRIADGAVTAWLDDRQIIEYYAYDGALSLRSEMESCMPLGLASWKSTGVIRHFSLLKLSE